MNTPAPSPIDELQRIPAPAPPFGIACDGTDLWIGSGESRRIYGLDHRNGRVFEEARTPGRPFGLCVTGDELRVITGDEADDRTLHRYIMGKDFKAHDTLALPEATGSQVAYDGDALYVLQRFARSIVELAANGSVLRRIAMPREAAGLAIAGGCFYLLSYEGEAGAEFRIARFDVRGPEPQWTEHLTVPFPARSLACDGERFWTCDRERNELVAFARGAA